MTRALEQPADKPEVFTDASGKATPVPVLDNTGVTGKYVSSEGKAGRRGLEHARQVDAARRHRSTASR